MTQDSTSPARDGGIQVIARAASILRSLNQAGLSLGALAKSTGLPRSTVQRIVDALAAESLVETGEGGVRPGWALQKLALLGQTAVSDRVRHHLQALFDRTHETVDVSTRHGREVAFLDRVISDQELRVVPILDRPRPLHAMANGKALLACMTDAEVAQLLREPLVRLTARTKSTIRDLLPELEVIRGGGFAFDREEHAPGVCAVGLPIRVPGLQTHAISVVLPVSRFEESLPKLQQALSDCRGSIEAELSRD